MLANVSMLACEDCCLLAGCDFGQSLTHCSKTELRLDMYFRKNRTFDSWSPLPGRANCLGCYSPYTFDKSPSANVKSSLSVGLEKYCYILAADVLLYYSVLPQGVRKKSASLVLKPPLLFVSYSNIK